MKRFLVQHSLAAGLGLMFLLTWPVDLANSSILPIKIPLPVHLFVGWGFVFASLIMTGWSGGKAGMIALLRRFFIWRVGIRWYMAALFFYPLLMMAAVGILSICTSKPLQFNSVMAYQIFGAGATLPLFILPFFLFDAVSNGEEIGWRGYLLPRLQARHTPLESSIIVGLLWGAWHLPRYLEQDGGSFVFFMIRIVADSILYTWLFNQTGGSLLLTTIMHASGNTAGMFLPLSPDSNAILVFLTWIMALIVLKYQAGKFIFFNQPGQQLVSPGREMNVKAGYQPEQQ